MHDLENIRDRMIPMMQVAVEQYRGRMSAGYPAIVDEVERGTIGLEFASYAGRDTRTISLFARTSRYSICGTLSATTPAPAWKL